MYDVNVLKVLWVNMHIFTYFLDKLLHFILLLCSKILLEKLQKTNKQENHLFVVCGLQLNEKHIPSI